MAAVTVATVAKKVAAALASNKKGRKFIGYVIGISVFIKISKHLIIRFYRICRIRMLQRLIYIFFKRIRSNIWYTLQTNDGL